MKETFKIELAERKKINKIGAEIVSFGFFFFFIFALFLLPAKYLPSEIAIIYLFEVVNRNVYIFLSGSILVILLGDWLKGLRNYEKVDLELKTNGILLLSKNQKIELEFDKIKNIKGVMNLVHRLSNIHKLNFVIKMNDNKKYEIRAHKDVFNGLTDYFYTKN